MRFVIAFFVMMLVAAPVQAFDDAGNYIIYGKVSCGKWILLKEDYLTGPSKREF